VKSLLTILFCFVVAACQGFELAWTPSPSPVDGYILWRRVPNTDYLPQGISVGNVTNYDYESVLIDGPNWFSLTAWHNDGTGLYMSDFSNEICVTSTPALEISQTYYFTTNILGGWQPVQTNHFRIPCALPAGFVRDGIMVVRKTNVLTLPHP